MLLIRCTRASHLMKHDRPPVLLVQRLVNVCNTIHYESNKSDWNWVTPGMTFKKSTSLLDKVNRFYGRNDNFISLFYFHHIRTKKLNKFLFQIFSPVFLDRRQADVQWQFNKTIEQLMIRKMEIRFKQDLLLRWISHRKDKDGLWSRSMTGADGITMIKLLQNAVPIWWWFGDARRKLNCAHVPTQKFFAS